MKFIEEAHHCPSFATVMCFCKYDSHANIIKTVVSNATTSRISTVEYDASGNVVKEVNGAGNVTLYEFDGNNQLTTKSAALNENSTPAIIAEYTYDAYSCIIRTNGIPNPKERHGVPHKRHGTLSHAASAAFSHVSSFEF